MIRKKGKNVEYRETTIMILKMILKQLDKMY